MNTEIDVNGQKANIESTIKFTEKDIVTTTKKDYGILINTQIIKKSNEGNVMAPSESVLKKNIFQGYSQPSIQNQILLKEMVLLFITLGIKNKTRTSG